METVQHWIQSNTGDSRTLETVPHWRQSNTGDSPTLGKQVSLTLACFLLSSETLPSNVPRIHISALPCPTILSYVDTLSPLNLYHHHHHHHKHGGLDPLIRSVSRVTAARANASSVFQLFSFLVVCSGMISKGFDFVSFFANVKASSVCIDLSCLVCL